MRWLAEITSLLCLSVMATATSATEPINTIRVRVTEYAPLYFQQNDTWRGLDVELVTALVEGAGYKVSFESLPWARALESLKTGDIDIVLNVTWTAERANYMHFIGPQRQSRRILAVRKENADAKVTNLDELAVMANKCGPIGIQLGANYSPEFDRRLKEDAPFSAHFDRVPKANTLPLKTVMGHNCGFVEEEYWIKYQIQQDKRYDDLRPTTFAVADERVHYGINPHLPASVVQRLRESYQKQESTGVMEKIRRKWGVSAQ